MKCKYQYQGKQYTRTQILLMIRDGVIAAPLNEIEARRWLNETLGLEEEQVKVIKGLLDNGAYGRFLSDGNILMSDELEGVQFHEAFHRVFRMMLTKEEQQSLIDEFLSRPDAQRTIDNITKRYPEASQATRVEEALAEEFMYYNLNKGRYPVPEQTKTLFDRIIDFFKQLLGINSTVTIKELYDAINKGKYRAIKPLNYNVEAADMLYLQDGVTMSVEEKNEFLAQMFNSVINDLSDAKVLYEFVEGRIPTEQAAMVINKAIVDILNPGDGYYKLYTNNPILASAIHKDVYGDASEIDYSTPTKKNSVILEAFKEYAAQFSLKLSFVDGDNTVKKTEQLDDVANEENQIGDNAFMKVSFEFDPRGNLSKAVKMMMASIFDLRSDGTANPSPRLNLPQSISYNEATKIIYHTLSGVPNNLKDVLTALQNKAKDFPFINIVLDRLKGDSDQAIRLRSEFMAGFVKNRYTLVKSSIGKGENRFINISDDSQGKKYVQLWKNRLETSGLSGQQMLDQLRATKDLATIASIMGFDELIELDLLDKVLDPKTKQTLAERINAISNVAIRALESGVAAIDLYTYRDNNTDLSSSVRIIGEFVADKGIPFDMLLLNSERKRIFAISEHTYQTIIEGHLNHIADEVRGISNIQDRRKRALERIKEELPHLLHVENFDGKNVRSAFLRQILDGKRIGLFVMDGVDAYNNPEIHFSKIGYTDYLSQYINNILNGNILGFKHGDRKVIYGYSLDKPFVDQQAYDAIIDDAVMLSAEYLLDEVRRIRAVKENPSLTENLDLVGKASELQNFDFIDFNKIKNVKTVKGILGKVEGDLKTFFIAQSDRLLKAMNESGVTRKATHGFFLKTDGTYGIKEGIAAPVGIDSNAYDQFLDANGENAIKAIAAFTASNYFFGFIEQLRTFNGEPYNYKSFVDFYKRAQMQSSTGTSMMYGEEIESHLQKLNARDTFVIDGVEYTYGVGDLKRPGYMSEVVVYDQSFDASSAVDDDYVSVIDGSKVSMIQYVTEKGILEQTGNKELARSQALINVNAMKGYDENDGQSWINIFMWREYMNKAGKWSPYKENTFQIELAALQADTLADTTVFINPNQKNIFHAKQYEGTIAVKIFDVQDIEDKLSPKNGSVGFMMRYTDYPTVIKPQYTGPFTPNDPNKTADQKLNLLAGRKTAYMVLAPSTIKGTKLELMNKIMLRNGLDGQHMVSAAKYGRKSYVKGMELYTEDGSYNEGIEELLPTQVSYLEMKYHKDQVNVQTTPKDEIKNATQSVKTVLQNMFNNGVPVDYVEQPADDTSETPNSWQSLTEEQKVETSPIYGVYKNYRDSLYEFVTGAANDLAQELDNSDTMVRTLRKAVKDRQEAKYIVESVEKFITNKSIDAIPNSERVENILYSIITRGAINLYRPGNGAPQVSTSLWEAPDVKRSKNGKSYTTKEQVTKFYTLRKDGGLNPAEVIKPLPPKMIPIFLKRFSTSNIIEALDAYHKLPQDQKFVFKSLRIPNQQFSFNDVFLVDRYTSPLMQNFVVTPSEIVPKTDADFDLDKQQSYGFIRDEDGHIYQPIKGEAKDDVLGRMRQWKSIGRLHLPDTARDEMYDDNFTYGDVIDSIKEEIEELKVINEKLKRDHNLLDETNLIHQALDADLDNIAERYDIVGDSISDMLTDVSNQMSEIVNSGVWQGARFKDLKNAQQSIFDLFNSFRDSERDNNVERRKTLYGLLEKAAQDIEDIELEYFTKNYPTVEKQTHPHIRHNQLLQAEIDLLLHPTNAHKMISSADDSYISKQQFYRVMSKLTGKTVAEIKANEEEYVLGKMDSAEFLSVAGNARRGVQMIGSKNNVGPVALSITHHNIAQVDGMKLNPNFNVIEKGKVVGVSSRLPIKGKENDLDFGYTITDDNKLILDVFSNLLTAQVDGVNNPYAPRLNLTDVTLPLVLMMLRRGVGLPTILNMVNNPLVRRFINAKNINDSLVVGATGMSRNVGVKLGSKRLMESFLKKHGINKYTFNDYHNFYRSGKGKLIDPTKLEARLGQKTFTDLDVQVLAAYMLIQEQATSLLKTVTDMTPDTSAKKSRSEVIESMNNTISVIDHGITDVSHRNGFLSPFYGNQAMYLKQYEAYYELPHDALDGKADKIGAHLRKADMIKMRNKMSTDFMTFLLQNYVEGVKDFSANDLLKGVSSFIHELSTTVEDNYTLKMLLPILNITVDPNDGVALHNVKIMDQGVTTVSINDMYEEFLVLDDVTQQKLIATSVYQAGLGNSPYSLRPILDVDMMDSLLREGISYFLSQAGDGKRLMIDRFTELFMLANPQFLPRNKWQAQNNNLPYYTEKVIGDKFFKIINVENSKEVEVRGNVAPAILNYKITNVPQTRLITPLQQEEGFTDKPVDTPNITDNSC